MKKKTKLILILLAFAAMLALSMIVAFFIAKANLAKDFKPASDGEVLVTLEYASEKAKEDDVQTTAVLIFYDDHTCHVEGAIAAMYNFSYSTKWSNDGGLKLDDVSGVTAECTDEASLAFIQMLSLATAYDMEVVQSVTEAGDGWTVFVEGFNMEGGESLMQLTFTLSAEKAAKLGL